MPSAMARPARRIGAMTSFLPAMAGASGGRDRGLDHDQVGRQVARHFVAEQGRGLAHHGAEQLDRAVPVAQDGELVLHQRVVDDRQSVHG